MCGHTESPLLQRGHLIDLNFDLHGSAATVDLGGGASVRRPPELAVEQELVGGVAGQVLGVQREGGRVGLALVSKPRDLGDQHWGG